MRASSLFPLLVAALAVLTPIAAQDPNADPGNTDSTDTSTDNTDTSTDTSIDSGAMSTDAGAGAEPTASNTDAAPGASPTDGGSAMDPNGDGISGDPPIVPSEPYGDTVVNIGAQVTAQWNISNPEGDQWTNMSIELMTGSNFNMIQLSVVGSGINAMNQTEYKFTAPEVHPTSQIYFLQFTNTGFSDKLWTTRFTIAGKDGSTTPPANNDTNADGETIYWGVGALGPASVNGTIAPAPTAPAQPGVGPNGVTLYTQGINTGTELPLGVTLTGVAAATLGAKGPGGSGAARAAATPAAVIGAVIAAAAFLA